MNFFFGKDIRRTFLYESRLMKIMKEACLAFYSINKYHVSLWNYNLITNYGTRCCC